MRRLPGFFPKRSTEVRPEAFVISAQQTTRKKERIDLTSTLFDLEYYSHFFLSYKIFVRVFNGSALVLPDHRELGDAEQFIPAHVMGEVANIQELPGFYIHFHEIAKVFG